MELGKFKPAEYSKSNLGDGKSYQRMAGDYLKDFTGSVSNVGKLLSGNKDLRGDTRNESSEASVSNTSSQAPVSNTSKVLFGASGKPPEKATTAKPAETPAASGNQPAGLGEIDYSRWAADSVANDPTSAAAGADAAYWEKTYRRNNSAYEQNKALMASHQGPKTYDDLKSNAQSRSGTGNGATRNTESIADYEAYTRYATAKQGVEEWEKASAKYRK